MTLSNAIFYVAGKQQQSEDTGQYFKTRSVAYTKMPFKGTGAKDNPLSLILDPDPRNQIVISSAGLTLRHSIYHVQIEDDVYAPLDKISPQGTTSYSFTDSAVISRSVKTIGHASIMSYANFLSANNNVIPISLVASRYYDYGSSPEQHGALMYHIGILSTPHAMDSVEGRTTPEEWDPTQVRFVYECLFVYESEK
ncbi:hypothetical protein [Xenorhabdus bharatensis]|uniref:hypothetical protein n=1 Tax=Xenorhabdus bharatensis TaxID=3136256 RepID=UPI0030F3BB23